MALDYSVHNRSIVDQMGDIGNFKHKSFTRSRIFSIANSDGLVWTVIIFKWDKLCVVVPAYHNTIVGFEIGASVPGHCVVRPGRAGAPAWQQKSTGHRGLRGARVAREGRGRRKSNEAYEMQQVVTGS